MHARSVTRLKGSDLGSIASETRQLTRFFNPRSDAWSDHFRLDAPQIATRSAIGEVTARILGFNSIERLVERAVLMNIGRYPSAAARQVMETDD